MREIKFRVWDKDYSKMHICGTNTHDAINFLENQACYYNQQNGCGSLPNGEGTYDLMQYTGLKDKNGVEIYEGDIVKHCNIHWGHNDIQNFIVEWDETISQNGMQLINCGWKFKATHKGFSTCFVPSKDFEVIGNIYQNPELLERGE